jgi:hypothetical protein
MTAPAADTVSISLLENMIVTPRQIKLLLQEK